MESFGWHFASIGKNIGGTDVELPEDEWASFRREVSDLFLAPSVGRAPKSAWKGQAEEAAYVVGELRVSPGEAREVLSELCRKYYQEAIGFGAFGDLVEG